MENTKHVIAELTTLTIFHRLMFICFQMCGGDGNDVTTDQQGVLVVLNAPTFRQKA